MTRALTRTNANPDPNTNPHLYPDQSAALCATAPLLASFPDLLPPFASSLLALPQPQRLLLLPASGDSVTLPVVSSVPYVLKPLTASWQPLQVRVT